MYLKKRLIEPHTYKGNYFTAYIIAIIGHISRKCLTGIMLLVLVLNKRDGHFKFVCMYNLSV